MRHLSEHQIITLEARLATGIAGVHHQPSMFENGAVVHVGVVRHDQRSVIICRQVGPPVLAAPPGQGGMFPGRRYGRHKGVVELGVGAARLQQLDQAQGRALAHIINVLLIGHAEYEDPGAVKPTLLRLVEGPGQFFHHMGRHAGIDLSRELNESC